MASIEDSAVSKLKDTVLATLEFHLQEPMRLALPESQIISIIETAFYDAGGGKSGDRLHCYKAPQTMDFQLMPPLAGIGLVVRRAKDWITEEEQTEEEYLQQLQREQGNDYIKPEWDTRPLHPDLTKDFAYVREHFCGSRWGEKAYCREIELNPRLLGEKYNLVAEILAADNFTVSRIINDGKMH